MSGETGLCASVNRNTSTRDHKGTRRVTDRPSRAQQSAHARTGRFGDDPDGLARRLGLVVGDDTPGLELRTIYIDGEATGPMTCAFYLFIRQPMGRKSALRREIPWILRGFQGRLSC